MNRIAVFVLALVLPLAARAATFTVNSTGDGTDAAAGNGVCATSGGVCTLRAAIQEANALAGTDIINFAIGSGPQTIAPATDLPVITGALTIDGTTQPGAGSGPRILLDGAGVLTTGLDDSSASMTVRGLAIGGFTTAGIRTLQNGDSVTIERCFIGVGLDGLTAMGNGDGIRAVISDLGGSSLIVGNITGGGNVISGNLDMGIEITDNGGAGAKLGVLTLQGNIIGLGADGMTAVPNLGGGIRTNLQFTTITIGGSLAGRNIISGNGGAGYQTAGFLQADTMIVSFNYIGVAQDGITARGNGGGAFLVARQYTVESNVVAANAGNGLSFSTCNALSPIRGNRIGVAADGSALGNSGAGITWSSLNGALIGGPGADQNLIAFNGGPGIRVSGGQAEIDGNSIHDNGGLGIDIGTANVVDPNDANDADTGSGNNLQNHPVILTALRSGGATFVTGSINSAPSATYLIHLYSSTVADPSGFGEGETYLGQVTATTNAGGTASFNFNTAGAPVGSYVTATATDTAGNTSEFSNALDVAAPPQFRFSAASGVASESGTVTLTIERVNNSIGSASVNWATTPGSATAADFTPSSGTATFASGQITRTITIPITPDTLDEADETFSVVLSNPSAGAEIGSPSSETVTINDDDAPPSISINDAGTAEGNAGSTPLAFNVTLGAASGKTVSVDYVTTNGTAIAGSDYTATAGTLTFAPGETSKAITVQLIGDTATELAETFNVTLANPVDVTINDGAAVGTINNDDGSPSVTISDVAVIEGNTGTSAALFTLTLSGPTTAMATVDWSTSNGTATAGVDYEAASGTATFTPGSTTATIAVTIDGDTLVENNETFFVDLSGPVNASLADAQGGGTIADDDGVPSLSINDPAVIEGVAATFTVTLAPASSLPVTVAYATSAGSALAGTDYTPASSSLTFAAGETSKTISVATSNDAIAESSEDFALTLSSPTGANIGDATGNATIIDDDGMPRVTIGNTSGAEGNAGTSLLTFTIDLSHPSASSIDVNWATADASASAGSDYAASGGTVTFVPGQTSATVDVPVDGDTVVEPDETFFVQLTGATNATITDGEGAGTITNDDGAVGVSISNASGNEGTGGTTTFTFDVTLSAQSSQSIDVQWVTADSTANAGSDYTAGAGSLVFNPGETLKTVSVAVSPDSTFEPDETFFVNLIAATNATLVDSQGSATIVNDDAAPLVPSISIGPASLAEGDAGTASLLFPVTLDVATVNTVTVSYATGGGTALAGGDYAATTGTLSFAPGATTQSIAVPVIGDTLVEGNETLVVTLASPSNAMLGTATAVGTILDDDVAPAVPSIAITGGSVAEGDSGSTSIVFPVTLSVPTVATVSVSYATSNGSAAGGADYSSSSGLLTFAPGVTTRNIVVPVIGDTIVEGNETFTVTLSAPSNATLGAATATGIILDDDTAPVVPSISIAGASASEGNAGSTSITLAVTLNAPTVVPVTVNYATSNGTALAGADYAATTGTLTFAPGVTSQNLVVPVIGDTIVEGNETFNVMLSAPSNATLATATAAGTILDDDALPSLPSISIGDVTRDEGDGGTTLFTFPVTLSSASTDSVSVGWNTVSGTANPADDFVAATGTLAFAPGVTSQSVVVLVNGDTKVERDETFTVQLSASTNATLARAAAVGTIRNDDHSAAPIPSLSAAPVRVAEDAGVAVVTLTLTAPANGASVRWMTHGGTATGSADFTESSGRVVFGSGATATLAVPIVADSIDEPDETLVVELFDAQGLTLRDDRVEITIVDDDTTAPERTIVMAVGSLHGVGSSHFGTAVQMLNFSDVAAAGSLWIRPAGMTDATRDVTIPYVLGPRELLAYGDLLAEHGLEGLFTLDVIPNAGATPRMTVRIFDDGSGHGTTGFTLPTVSASDALVAGGEGSDEGVLIAPDDPIAMRFNVGIRTLDAGATMTIDLRTRTGDRRHTTTREFAPNWFNQMTGSDFAGVPLQSGDYLVIRLTRGSAILYGAAIDNTTNDPSVQVVTR